MKNLEGKVAVVTGGANGIGEAVVRLFCASGMKVEFCDKDRIAGERLENEMKGSAAFQWTNLSIGLNAELWAHEVCLRNPNIHVLVNNAGIDPRHKFSETENSHWEDVFNVNCRSMFLVSREISKNMGNGSSIINLGSICLHNSAANLTAYTASKGAVIGLTRSMARDLGSKGIRVNAVSPGCVFTERQKREHLNAEYRKKIMEHQCIPDEIQPEEIASVILFLAGSGSAAITGQEILADRGWCHS